MPSARPWYRRPRRPFEDLIVEHFGKQLPDAHRRLSVVGDDVITHVSQVGFLLPDNEEQRLDALAEYDIDDRPIEDSFDRLTDPVTSHFDTAVAFTGVAAVDTSTDFGSGTSSTVKAMETPSTARVHVEDATATEATVTVSGLGDADGTQSVRL